MCFLVPIFLLGMGFGQGQEGTTPVQEPVQTETGQTDPLSAQQGSEKPQSSEPDKDPSSGETANQTVPTEGEPAAGTGQTDPPSAQQGSEKIEPAEPDKDPSSGETANQAVPDEEEPAAETGEPAQNADLSSLPPIVDYDISARLDPDSKKVSGRLLLLYTNHAPDLIGDLYFHLYANAFKNNSSAYFWKNPNSDPDHWSYVSIRHASVAGLDRTGDMEYVQAEDAPPGDRTVMRIPLLEPLLPGETVRIEMDFETKLPKAHDRTGYGKDFFFVAQWFPKIGVWETIGQRGRTTAGWNCHAFHSDTEFYANFGRYKVRIETPPDFVVGATGVLRGSEQGIYGTSHLFEQDRIHDFAFVAGKRIIPETRRFLPSEWISDQELASAAAVHGVEPDQLMLPPVNMILLIQPEHRDQIDRHFEALAQAIKYFGLWFGPYPYDTITMVDPARDAESVGGMEYPTLITLGTSLINPESYLDLEEVTIHEFIHQYWYGMVGSNEFEEAWLDEGLATYCTGRLLDILHGPAPVYLRFGSLSGSAAKLTGLPFHILTLSRQIGQVPVPVSRLAGFRDVTHMSIFTQKGYADQGADQVMRNGWAYLSRSGYGTSSYYKPAAVLWQLERELGSEVMVRALRAYFREWAFKHPGTGDFIATIEAVSGRDLKWFFDELLYKPGFLDYEVALVGNQPVNEGAGYRNSETGPVLGDSAQKVVHPSVVIRNLGTIRYPVDILINFEGGRSVRKHWQGDYPWVRYDFYESEAISEVVIDPDEKLVLDCNRANNSYIVKPEPLAARKWYVRLLVGAQHLLQTLAGGL